MTSMATEIDRNKRTLCFGDYILKVNNDTLKAEFMQLNF